MVDDQLRLSGERTAQAPAALSTGRIWVDHVADGLPPSRVRVMRAYVEPGARTAWHRHDGGQILLVDEGLLVVQERGAAAHLLRPGQSDSCAPGTWHWHGAGPDHLLVALAVVERDDQGHEAVWGEKVTDDAYARAMRGETG